MFVFKTRSCPFICCFLVFVLKSFILYTIVVCKQRNIPRLIYTSTVNVVFGGNPIEEGDEETVPYFPLEKVLCSWDAVAFAVFGRIAYLKAVLRAEAVLL